jgi:flavin-dependent dehydrogenase
MKIIVVGAGEGGLVAAYHLAMKNFEVEVYEKSKRDAMGYDWHDVVSANVFSELDIELPSQAFFFKTRDWSFIVPPSERWLKIPQNPNAADYSIERRPLINLLADRAESAGAKLFFNKKVEELVVEGKEIKGITVGAKRLKADIVIDSSGAFSRFRASLPRDADIQNTPSSQEIFFAYRAFFAPNEGVEPDAEHSNKCYIKPLGRSGIAWCIQDPPTGNYDVLIGQTGFMTKNDVNSVLTYLKRVNPALGSKLVRGGDAIRTIPVRYPISKMVADGYAVVGDAAFMTIPMLGSGIASSMRAGKILADAISENKTSLASGLWDYQVKFMTQIGAQHIAIDVLKRWLLEAKDADLKYIMDSGLIGERDLAASSSGGLPALTPHDIIQKALAGKDNIPLLLKLNNLIGKSKNAHKTALGIPEKYDETAIRAWQKKLDESFAE